LQRDKLEYLARYVARPPSATERVALTNNGQVRYTLKTPYRDGTAHVIFEPEDFISRRAALVPKPRAHLTRYHGVFAPASPDRARIVPKTRAAAANECAEASATGRQRAPTWAQRLKRFAIDIAARAGAGARRTRRPSSRVPPSAGFPHVADPRAKVLILGSLPGQKSLEMRQYYAQPHNAFWKIMGGLFGAGAPLPYAARLARLIECRVAVWDVLATGERAGSLDSAIVSASCVGNDLVEFFERHGAIRRVCFNGGKAAELYRRLVLPTLMAPAAALDSRLLPSTSPVHASLSFSVKLVRWSPALSDVTLHLDRIAETRRDWASFGTTNAENHNNRRLDHKQRRNYLSRDR
jgi:hypoxanthine-DNA glycosylase